MVAVAALLGTLSGVVTGLIPGIHVNTVTALVLAGCAALGSDYSILLAFVCALAVSHTFFDVVPGLFLGVPGDETFALLPGHRLVKKGQGQSALRFSIVGSSIGLMIGIVLVLVLVGLDKGAVDETEQRLGSSMFFILAGVSAVLIVTDRRRLWSLFTFLTSGLFGLFVFASPLIAGGPAAAVNALFPALAGLFGVAGLLFAVSTSDDDSVAPLFDGRPVRIDGRTVAWPGVRGGLAGMVVGLLPGLGSANAATLLLLLERWFGRRGTDDEHDRAYLVTTSSLNTAEALFAIAALYLIDKSRSGASIAVEQILGGNIADTDLLRIVGLMAGAGLVAFLILWRFGRQFALRFHTVDHAGINWGVIVFLVILTGCLLGLGGLTVLVAATAVGSVPLYFGVRRAQLMGFFLVPVMLFYSGYQGQLVDWLSIGQRTSPMLPSITITGILSAVVIALGAGIVVYLFTTAKVILWSRLLRGGTLAVGLIGGLVLLTVLTGWVYPPHPEWSRSTAVPMVEASGRITRVIDGDTFEISTVCRKYRVRLKGIDAPERGKRDGDAAEQWARERFGEQSVIWKPIGVDRYGRFLGNVYLKDGTFVNAEIIRRGHARTYTRFRFDDLEQFQMLEKQARSAGRGMWGSSSSTPEKPSSTTNDGSRKNSAPEVLEWDDNDNGRVSCAEARSHGIAPVRRGHPAYRYMRDGDGDGVVCE